MIKLIMLRLICIAGSVFISIAITTYVTVSYAADSKTKRSDSLEKKWDKDKKIFRFTSTDDFVVYGIAGSLKEISDSSDIVIFWTSTLYKPAKRTEFKGVLKNTVSSTNKWEFNCKSNIYNIATTVYYDEKGRVINSYNDSSSWEEPIPNTIADNLLQFACLAFKTSNTDSTGMKAQEIPEGVGKKAFVLETMNSGGYTYIHALTESGYKQWLALPEIVVSVGDKIEYPETPPLKNFESKTLNKHFDEISFIPGLRIYK